MPQMRRRLGGRPQGPVLELDRLQRSQLAQPEKEDRSNRNRNLRLHGPGTIARHAQAGGIATSADHTRPPLSRQPPAAKISKFHFSQNSTSPPKLPPRPRRRQKPNPKFPPRPRPRKTSFFWIRCLRMTSWNWIFRRPKKHQHRKKQPLPNPSATISSFLNWKKCSPRWPMIVPARQPSSHRLPSRPGLEQQPNPCPRPVSIMKSTSCLISAQIRPRPSLPKMNS